MLCVLRKIGNIDVGETRKNRAQNTMKLLVADDHTLFRDALVQYIQRGIEGAVVAVAKDFHEAYDWVKKDQDFQLVLLDLRMPGMNGLNGFKKLSEDYPQVKLALMSGMAEPEDVKQALDLGAKGYFPKTLSGKALINAIKDVLDGDTFIPKDKENSDLLPAYYADTIAMKSRYNGFEDGQEEFETKPQSDVGLTPREYEVLEFLANGASNKEIANALNLQLVTIKLHVRGICRKLNANNRTQAALKAVQMGIVKTAAEAI